MNNNIMHVRLNQQVNIDSARNIIKSATHEVHNMSWQINLSCALLNICKRYSRKSPSFYMKRSHAVRKSIARKSVVIQENFKNLRKKLMCTREIIF